MVNPLIAPSYLNEANTSWSRFTADINLKVLFYQFIFLITGLISTMGAQQLKYEHAAGMVLVIFLPSKHDSSKEQVDHKGVICVALLDVIGQAVLTVGLFYVGSGLYQVIYSSIIVFAAIYNKLLLNRSLHSMQWLAIFIITFGLAINSLSHKDESQQQEEDAKVAFGFFITLMGVSVYSLVYTLNDYLMTAPNAKLTPPNIQCLWVGGYSTLVCLILMLFLSLPTLSKLPLWNMKVLGYYLLLIMSAFGHNVTYFELIHCTGAVATGVLQALRAVLVFGLSHLFFCDQDHAQCFNSVKGLSTFVVVTGVLGFAYAQSVKGVVYEEVDSHSIELEGVERKRIATKEL